MYDFWYLFLITDASYFDVVCVPYQVRFENNIASVTKEKHHQSYDFHSSLSRWTAPCLFSRAASKLLPTTATSTSPQFISQEIITFLSFVVFFPLSVCDDPPKTFCSAVLAHFLHFGHHCHSLRALSFQLPSLELLWWHCGTRGLGRGRGCLAATLPLER